MKKFALLFLIYVFLSPWASANELVTMAIGDWAPYTSESDVNSKLLENVVTEAFKLERIDVRYAYFPWKRSYVLTKEGKFDGTFPWARTEEHMNHFYIHQVPLVKDKGVYFHLKDNPFDWHTIDDLKKYTVGVTLGFKEERLYKEKGIPAVAAPSEALNFKKLLAGRIDVYQTSITVGYKTINKLFSPEQASRITHHPKPAVENTFFVLFSKKTLNGLVHAEKFDSGLIKLQASGRYDQLFKAYSDEPN